MLFPSSTIDSLNAVVHTIYAELVVAKSYHFAMLEVGSISDGIIATTEPVI